MAKDTTPKNLRKNLFPYLEIDWDAADNDEDYTLSLADEIADKSCRAAEMLGEIGDKSAVKPLIRLLNGEMEGHIYHIVSEIDDEYDEFVMIGGTIMAAAEALGEIGDKRAIEPLIKVLDSDDWDICDAAKEALEKLGHTIDDSDNLIEPSKEEVEDSKEGILASLSFFKSSLKDSKVSNDLKKSISKLESSEDIVDLWNKGLKIFLESHKLPPKTPIEMLFQISIEEISGNSYRNEAPKNIIKIALDIDTKLSCSIISNMKIEPTVFEKIMGLIFQMSFTHSIESTRKGATKLVKNVGVSKIKKIFDDDKATFNYWWASKNWNGNTPFPESRQLENLKRLIDYDDSRFIPLIMKHSHVNGFNDLEKPFLACLKRFNPNKNDLVEMLFKIALEDAPQDKAKNAVMIALNVDKHKSYDKIRKEMKIVTGKDRSERKLSVNRRLMFITIFRNMTTPDDIPYLRELMKKDRSPRVKKQLAQIIIEHT
ncbi:MAG TPA: hypothetical protein EYQ70_04300 [Marine Group III euryarchaeote]|uniref:HEAT repeat domain-containing protein n=1 Tax=Marine Group III euryarchaeote TaxID=2173149 RepID=A0A7J4GW40_9ARCH|nr:hypothetical protein [Marine Group III euryarchaeote]